MTLEHVLAMNQHFVVAKISRGLYQRRALPAATTKLERYCALEGNDHDIAGLREQRQSS